MDLSIKPKALSGAVTPPPSKSVAHRLLICAALAEGTSLIHSLAFSDDIRATASCLETLGAKIEPLGQGIVRVEGIGSRRFRGERPQLDCGESGSTLRFLIPIALALAGGGVFTGRGRLMQRPQQPYFDLFREKGIYYEQREDTLTLRGTLSAGEYRLPGNVSSQFFTGLLLALPLVDGSSKILASTVLESADYISLTLDAMSGAGLSVGRQADAFFVKGQNYRPFDRCVEADWSQAAFFLAARTLGNQISVHGMKEASLQGDKRILSFAEQLSRPGDVEIDVAQCPDLVPPLAAMAAVRDGTCRISGAARLRVKESDRLTAVSRALSAMGAEIREEENALWLRGVDTLRGGTVIDCCKDHRIAMMAAVAATRCEGGELLLKGADCVSKSYPDFWEVYESLGGQIHVVELGE